MKHRASWAIHARVITAIRGDGSVENTFFTIVDPDGGRQYQSDRHFHSEIRRGSDSHRLRAFKSCTGRRMRARKVKAQSLGHRIARVPRRARAMAVVEIASAIVGASMQRI
jgi:hypothetical protein